MQELKAKEEEKEEPRTTAKAKQDIETIRGIDKVTSSKEERIPIGVGFMFARFAGRMLQLVTEHTHATKAAVVPDFIIRFQSLTNL